MKEFLHNRVAVTLSVLLLLLIILSVIALWFLNVNGEEGTTAEIYQDGELIKTVSLSDVEEPYTIRIDGDNGAYNIIEVRQGSIGITDASCPDKLCVNMGFIHTAGVPVTCLPNKVVIKITTDETGRDVPDEVAY